MLRVPVFVSVALSSVGLAPLYAVVRRARYFQPESFPKKAVKLMIEAADKAVTRARSRYGITLDYSMESICDIEHIMGKAYDLYRAAPQLVDARSMAFVFGAYIGETIRRNNPACAWEISHEAGTEDFYTLYRDDVATFPMEWCMNCITEGVVDDTRVMPNQVVRSAPQLVMEQAPQAGPIPAGSY